MVPEHGSDAREHGTWKRFKYLDDVRRLLLPPALGQNPTEAKMQDMTNEMNGELCEGSGDAEVVVGSTMMAYGDGPKSSRAGATDDHVASDVVAELSGLVNRGVPCGERADQRLAHGIAVRDLVAGHRRAP